MRSDVLNIMYLPRPRDCTFSPGDWEILGRYWHPVLFSTDVAGAPVKATLLDVDLVVYRTSQGVVAARDLCMHRGSPLSMGRMQGDEIECAYHGWRYGPQGECVRIPSQPAAVRISPRARLMTINCAERYGLIWACISEPCTGLPECPVLEDPSYRFLQLGMQSWQTSAARQVENFMDVSHFPFVHAGTFGNPDATEVARVEVEQTPRGLHYDFPYLASNPKNSPLGGSEVIQRFTTYDVTLPFTVQLTIAYPEKGTGRAHVAFDIASPVSARATNIFFVAARNFDAHIPDEEIIAYDLSIAAEDRPIVEGQRPEELPLDLSEELHVQADAVTIEYRKRLRELGLGRAWSA
jgi:phenylpropionate dioxygenase-like ring-hydroxylating dioxygenase large terminal subunit